MLIPQERINNILAVFYIMLMIHSYQHMPPSGHQALPFPKFISAVTTAAWGVKKDTFVSNCPRMQKPHHWVAV